MYLYPNNLKSKPILWFWYMRDIVIIGILTLISVFIYTQLNMIHFLVGTAVYALLTLRFDDMSILDFITYSCRFFISQPQTFTWKKEGMENHGKH
ncbi:hypothetical protein G7061_08375 [Erysipelothrix sp. HDW6B]|uniref:hypothetical protein n=1 Tax=Erysipelothrix sp. HDW6B TaxID=2714929 RepID=UPI00140D98FD|nr:hypothetical protein [Erysipelothrix sp. HDW6B]QIK86623.1 hypothetical protein G7061_08375 [Erysipelothrix sp. HDW6B]